jgi:hypothetical protein
MSYGLLGVRGVFVSFVVSFEDSQQRGGEDSQKERKGKEREKGWT